MSMSNEIDHTIALQALGWEPLQSIRERKGKSKTNVQHFE